jgi:xanthine dehydrogenase accessory factor
MNQIADIKVLVRGGGDMGSGVAWRLHRCGFKVLITEIPQPLSVRRAVSFCEAVYDGKARVEDVDAVLVQNVDGIYGAWKERHIPLLLDPDAECKISVEPDVLVDAILAKKNLGTTIKDAPLVMALGPGFRAGLDVHCVVETKRGHRLGRLLNAGSAQPNTGEPGAVMGITHDRVLRATATGTWESSARIGDAVKKGDELGRVTDEPVRALIDGVLRGLIRSNISVTKGLKIGDIDPRGIREYCFTISEKALAVSGGVLEGILHFLNLRNREAIS